MEEPPWNLEFGIIFASQAQKLPGQACSLIAFNFPLKQRLNKRLTEEGQCAWCLIHEFRLLAIQKHGVHRSPPPRRSSPVPPEKLLLITRACSLTEFVLAHFIFLLTKGGRVGCMRQKRT